MILLLLVLLLSGLIVTEEHLNEDGFESVAGDGLNGLDEDFFMQARGSLVAGERWVYVEPYPSMGGHGAKAEVRWKGPTDVSLALVHEGNRIGASSDDGDVKDKVRGYWYRDVCLGYVTLQPYTSTMVIVENAGENLARDVTVTLRDEFGIRPFHGCRLDSDGW